MHGLMAGVTVPNGFVDMLIKREYQSQILKKITLREIKKEIGINLDLLYEQAKRLYNRQFTEYHFRNLILIELFSTLARYDKTYLYFAFRSDSQTFKKSLHSMYVNQIKIEYDYQKTKFVTKKSIDI